MWTESAPRVGQWYLRQDTGELFRVVALDLATGTIDIQTFDGDVEEFDAELWREVGIEAAGPPEDCTGPFDDLEADDPDYTHTVMISRDWRQSLDVAPAAPKAWPGADRHMQSAGVRAAGRRPAP